MPFSAYSPSDLTNLFPIAITAVANGAAVSSPTGGWVDTAHYDYLHVIAYMGTGAVDVTVQTYENDVNSASGAVELAQHAFSHDSSSEDNTVRQWEVRCHGTKRYIGFLVSGSGTTATPFSLLAIGVKARSSGPLTQAFPTGTGGLAQLGLA